LALILPFVLPHLRRDLPKVLAAWPWVLILSACGVGAFNTLLYVGLQYTQAINSLLMQSTMPAIILLLSYLFFRERFSVFQGLGVVVSMLGVLVIISGADPSRLASLDLNRGDLWVFAAVVVYALYSALLRKRPAGIHPLTLVAVTFFLGDLMLAPFAAWETWGEGRAMDWSHPYTWMAIGYVAVFPSVLSYLCFNRGVELIGANRAGLFIHLNPLFGSFLAIVFLGETFAPYHGAGLALIVAGIFLSNRKKR
jgi:drug/metabolite transporter (DMT)-like permease